MPSVTPSPTVARSVRGRTGPATASTASPSWSLRYQERAEGWWPPKTSRKARSYSKIPPPSPSKHHPTLHCHLHELKEQISKLSEEQKSKFYQLTPHAVGKLIPTQVTSALRENCLKEFTLFVNNCTGLDIDKDTLYLFINSSLLNHSCAPNVTVEKCGDDLQHNKVIAIKDISKGEEVTESYLEGLELKTKTQMRTELQADCSFDCKCGVCTGSIPDQDGIISKIKQLVPSPTNPIVCTPITHNLRLERAAELTKQLYVGRFHARIAVLEQFVYASQKARDPIRLKKAVEFMKEEIGVRMMESSIFGNCYKIMEKKLERWSGAFQSMEEPSQEEMDDFGSLREYN